MTPAEAVAILHEHTEGRHDITGEESQEIEWLLSEGERLLADLKEYTKHKTNCLGGISKRECTCGLKQILK
jgi:hypothetical protein